MFPPGALADLLSGTSTTPMLAALRMGTKTADTAACRLDDEQTLASRTGSLIPIVDDSHEFGRIAPTNANSDVYPMGVRPIMALAFVSMPMHMLSASTIDRIVEDRERQIGHALCAPERRTRADAAGVAHTRAAGLRHRRVGSKRGWIVVGRKLLTSSVGPALRKPSGSR